MLLVIPIGLLHKIAKRLTVFWITVSTETSRKYPLRGYVPSPSRAAKKDNAEEGENSEIKQFFGPVELWIMVTDKGDG